MDTVGFNATLLAQIFNVVILIFIFIAFVVFFVRLIAKKPSPQGLEEDIRTIKYRLEEIEKKIDKKI